MQNQYEAIYEEIAKEMETGKTEKGLWTRLFAECSGNEQQTKVLYIKQRAEKLISAERTRLEKEASERDAEAARAEAAKLKQLKGTADARLAAAVRDGVYSIALNLLKDGVKPDGLDEIGHSLLELARKRNDRNMIQLLEAYGANQVTSAYQVTPTSELAEGANMQNLYEAILGEKNRIYYLAKFESFDQQGSGLKASWNWPALLAGGVWALYRKMYGWFFAFWGVAFLSNIFEKAGSSGLSAIIFLVPWIAFTIYADSLYHNNIKKKIAIAQLTVKEESKLLEYLRYKGGVQTWVIWVFGGLPVIGILAAILIPMFARH